VNDLAQQASGFQSNREKISFLEKLEVPVCQAGQTGFLEKLEVSVCQTRQSSFWMTQSVIVYFAEPSSAKPDVLVSETGGSRISRISDEASKTKMTNPDD
jgi:hypothetical protein